MQPVDFEDYVHQQNRNPQDSRDEGGLCVDFPSDDLAICRLRREVRTLTAVVPEQGFELMLFMSVI